MDMIYVLKWTCPSCWIFLCSHSITGLVPRQQQTIKTPWCRNQNVMFHHPHPNLCCVILLSIILIHGPTCAITENAIRLSLLRSITENARARRNKHCPKTSELLGNSGKTVTLVTSNLTRSVKWVFRMIKHYEDLESWTCEALKSRICEDLESWTCEALESRTCEDLESWTCEALKSRTCEDLEPWTCEAPKSRICEDLESWTCEVPKSQSAIGICENRKSTEDQVRRL
jgi:hypothetical protein